MELSYLRKNHISNDAEFGRRFAKQKDMGPKHAKLVRKIRIRTKYPVKKLSRPVRWLSRTPGPVQEDKSFLFFYINNLVVIPVKVLFLSYITKILFAS